MKKNHLLLLLGVAIVVGLAGVYFKISQSAGWSDSKTDRTIFQNLAVNDITKVAIRSTPASVTLEKKGGIWGVSERDGYPADFSKIRDLIKTLWELKAGQEMQVGPSQLGRLKVLPPGQGTDSGIEIDLKGDNEKDIASLVVGKSVDRSDAATGPAAVGRFLYNPAVKDRVYLVSESFFSVDPVTISSWLDKTFVVPGEIKEIDQAAWSNNPGWKVLRKDPKADWELEDSQVGETLDKSFSQSITSFTPSFVDVRPLSVSSDESGLKDPFKITVKTFDGFSYDFLVGKEGPDKARFLQLKISSNFPSTRVADPGENTEDKKTKDQEFDKKVAALKERLEKEKLFEKWVYLVPDWNLEQLLKRRDEIVPKISPPPAPAGNLVPTPSSTNLLPLPAATSPSPQSPPAVPPIPVPESSPTSSAPGATPTPDKTPAQSPTP
jgi:Domain of unknown function (DUF4340)